ncbi:MAG: hypothetical protein JWR19_500, partial [Pedosphaera sp.]|nr:hypothetical protein [Pedosphaera sp.]
MKKILTKALLASAGVALFTQAAGAQTVAYTHQDLLLGFRETGKANDLVVDLGAATQFYSPASTSPFAVSGLSSLDITAVFGNFNSVSWAVMGTKRLGDTGSNLNNTMWVTTPRLDLNTQSSALTQASSFSQQNPSGRIASIGSNFNGEPATANSSTATIQATGTGFDYSTFLGAGGNFQGTYLAANGSVESSTPSDFASGGIKYAYEDLYQLNPGSGSGTYLGFFALGSDATVTFSPVPEPSTL